MNKFKLSLVLTIGLLAHTFSYAQASLNNTEKSWRFQVYLDDNPIGYHLFQLKQQGEKQQIFIKAEFDVKLLFFTVYSYLHENAETWKGQCLKQLSSSTNDNGEELFVSLNSNAQATTIETQNGTSRNPSCVRSFAYWNPDVLNSEQLLNAQTGEIMDVEFTHLGTEQLALNRQKIEASRYRLTGEKLEIDLWYDSNKQWLALQSTTESGSQLRYQLQQGIEL